MAAHSRRQFLQVTTAAVAAAAPLVWLPAASGAEKAMRLGVFVGIGESPEATIAQVHELGFPTCQVAVEDFRPGLAGRLKRALEKYGVEATAINTGGPGRLVYDFIQGPETIGLVPRATRRQRIEQLKKASDLARECGVRAIHTHCGFIPENPNDPLYPETVEAIREVVSYCANNGQMFLYETGQETPITLLRAITDVGLDNQGVNLDTANLILYGKGNPLDALDVFGKHVRGMHAKDGLYPTNPKKLGEEVPIGQGKVDFPGIIRRLKDLGYTGAVTIEREISGPEQIEDILKAKAYLEGLVG